jgi:hypothetical protein
MRSRAAAAGMETFEELARKVESLADRDTAPPERSPSKTPPQPGHCPSAQPVQSIETADR